MLTYQDLGLLSAGGALFMAHQVAKEAMATISSVGDIRASLLRIGLLSKCPRYTRPASAR